MSERAVSPGDGQRSVHSPAQASRRTVLPSRPPAPPPASIATPAGAQQRSARDRPASPILTSPSPLPTAPGQRNEPDEQPEAQPDRVAPSTKRVRLRRWGIIGIFLAIVAAGASFLVATVNQTDPLNPNGQRVSIDTCHYPTAGQSVRCGPASFRGTPGGTKLFTIPVNDEVTLLCQTTGTMARNNQQPPTHESDVWARAQDSEGREAWVSAIVVDAWPPDKLEVPAC